MNSEHIRDSLTAMLRRKTGDPDLTISDFARLPGHAGEGYAFRISPPVAGVPAHLVVRLAPENVPAVGPADVLRQARLMNALGENGIPVPRMIYFGGNDDDLGRGYFVGTFVDGFKIGEQWPAIPSHDVPLARAGMKSLADLHNLPDPPAGSPWGETVTIADEIARLRKLFDRPTIDRDWAGPIDALLEALSHDVPESDGGCVHGDYHWGNVIFTGDAPSAIIDWEIAMKGPRLLDLGWMCFYADQDSFIEPERTRTRKMVLDPDEMVEAYAPHRKGALSDSDILWFRAFSAYRFGVFTCFNLMLHRRGKRHDPSWEVMALSVPRMMERGIELLSGRTGARNYAVSSVNA